MNVCFCASKRVGRWVFDFFLRVYIGQGKIANSLLRG